MKAFKCNIFMAILLLGIGVKAQTYDKKVSESFKVNSDVELVINATHTDVIIEAWNKNEVEVFAVMEVEGVSKVEADKILSAWEFEALASKSIVKVTSNSDRFNFDFDFDFPEIDFELPELSELPELPKLPELPELPKLPELPEIEFDYEAYKNDSTYLKRFKYEIQEQMEEFKNSDWKHEMDSMRNSDEYKRSMEEFKRATKEMALEMKDLRNSEEFMEAIEESKRMAEQARKEMVENKELWAEQAELAKEASKMALEMVERMKESGTLDSLKNYSENIYFNYGDSRKSQVKIKKHLKIKVPKNATFKLNVRHGKLNIPNSSKKMSANISYGNFIGGVIIGDDNDLNFSNSPVIISSLLSGNLTLTNVPNATFGTIANTNLFANSSDIVVKEIGENVDLSQKFGNLEIQKIVKDFKNFNLILDYSKATINLSNAAYSFHINNKKSSLELSSSIFETINKTQESIQNIEGYSQNKTTQNKLFLTAVYSTLNLN